MMKKLLVVLGIVFVFTVGFKLGMNEYERNMQNEMINEAVATTEAVITGKTSDEQIFKAWLENEEDFGEGYTFEIDEESDDEELISAYVYRKNTDGTETLVSYASINREVYAEKYL